LARSTSRAAKTGRAFIKVSTLRMGARSFSIVSTIRDASGVTQRRKTSSRICWANLGALSIRVLHRPKARKSLVLLKNRQILTIDST
jgi:hypothetical protein